LISNISLKLGNYIALHSGNSEQGEVIAYGIELVIGALIKIIALLSIAAWLHIVGETLIIALFSAGLRTFSGGVHCRSYGRCLLSSIVIFPSLGLITKALLPYLTVHSLFPVLAVSAFLLLGICILWVPCGNDSRPLSLSNDQRKFKLISLIIISGHFVVSITLLAVHPTTKVLTFIRASNMGLLWQGFTVTPLGYYLISRIDAFWEVAKGGVINAQ